VIEDLEGATTEPPRRWHVLAASLGTAGMAIALLVTLLSPVEIGQLPRASVPSASRMAAPLVIAVPQMSIIRNIEQTRERVCAWGPGIQWILVQGPASQVWTVPTPTLAVAIEPGTGRAIPVGDRVGETTMWMTVTCATSDGLAPRVDLKTIPR